MIVPGGSISNNLANTIPEVITTLRGKLKLQERLQMITEIMELINEEITASNARKFGMSSIARKYVSKQYTQQWYTDARANYLHDRIPATYRCCEGSEYETILHILRCSSRKKIHLEHNQTFEQ